ncbi:hypothetical protein GDO81_020148 [Engystomops pustulosus]|uniref:G-protein coupled receptors family 1 profile domain-containing protein n=1 Tax=Engystomops pustulosus TaxID=76066 RepID=A0AAV6YXF1_ENGPU|nr:hypothetical protein GDO81_020148 [Engystomops pustulosus]
MEILNQTSGSGFILLGLSDIPHLQIIFFVLFLIMYLIMLSGNVLLIIVVRINRKLQTPMYFFLSNLSMIDIGFSSTIVPKILINTLSKDRSISLVGCALQMYLHMALGAAESASIHTPLTFQLPFCKSHHVNHFFCEMPPFFKLSCKDTRLNEIFMYVAAQIIILFAFFLTLISYIRIISTILKTISSQGRDKAFSTCASHLTVVSIYYGAIIFIYLKPPTAQSPEIDKVISIIYTAVTPMLNPIIYSMRNKDVKDTIIFKLCRRPLK